MRQRPVTLKIAGTDRSTYLVETSLEIETNIDDDFASAQFNLSDVDFDVGKLAAVLIHKPGDASDKYFAGYATSKKRSHQVGERFDIALACDDYSRDLKYPEARLSATYTDTSDATIIGNALGTTNPSINTTTNVTHQTTIGSIEFEDDDGWTIVRDVAARSGARWYIDFDQKLHYFSATSVSVSHTFTDATAGGTRYDTFVEDVQPPQATKVVLTGAGTISTSVSDAQIGGRHIVAHINDSDVTTASDATDLANRKLNELGETAAYRITLRDSAPRAGERARLVNNEISVDSTLTIMRSRITIPRGASYVQNDVDLGRYIPRLTTEVAKDLSDIRGGGGGGSGLGGYAPRDHGHAGGADSPLLTADAFDDTDPTSPITYWSTIEHYVDGGGTAATTIQADIKDDTLAFEELTAIDLVVSDDAEKIGIDMDGTLTAGATSSGGTLTANTAVGWPSGDAPTIGLTSSDSTVTIEGDATNKEIDFRVVSALPAGTDHYTLYYDTGSSAWAASQFLMNTDNGVSVGSNTVAAVGQVLYIDDDLVSGSPATAYGIYIENISAGTNNYAIYHSGDKTIYTGGDLQLASGSNDALFTWASATNFELDVFYGSADVDFEVYNSDATYVAHMIVEGGLTVGDSSKTTDGTIRWDGSDLEGYKGAAWVSLTAGAVSAAGSDTQIQYNSSGSFAGDSDLTWVPPRIEVQNTISSGFACGIISLDENGNDTIEFGYNNDRDEGFIWVHTNDPLKFGTNGTEQMRILANGYIGFGTDAPSSLTEWGFATKALEFVDAGSSGASNSGWVEVEVGGTLGYLRVYSSK